MSDKLLDFVSKLDALFDVMTMVIVVQIVLVRISSSWHGPHLPCLWDLPLDSISTFSLGAFSGVRCGTFLVEMPGNLLYKGFWVSDPRGPCFSSSKVDI